MAINAAVRNVATQGINILTGQQQGFSWASVAASAIAVPVANSINNSLFGDVAKDGLRYGGSLGIVNQTAKILVESTTSALVSATTRVAIVGGKLQWEAVAADALSSFVSSRISRDGAIKSALAQEDAKAKFGDWSFANDVAQRRAASGSFLNSVQQVPGYADAAYGDGDGWQWATTADRASISSMTGSTIDSGSIWKNENQRKAWMDILRQDPTMTPEKFAHAQKMSMLADAAYLVDVENPLLGSRGTLPENVERVTNYGEGKLIGFTKDNFENKEIGFSASLFHDTSNDTYTLSIRGTDNGPDWPNGNVQAYSPSAPQYKAGIELATKLQDVLGDQFTDITGHSLGGGVGAAASMLTGIRATTFNAAGLNRDTVTSRGGTWSTERAENLITNYRVEDEALTSFQERGSFGSMPLSLLAPFIGPSAFALNAVAASLPNAAGRQITIRAFDQNNQRMSWLERNNVFQMQPVALHGMDYVMRGMLIDNAKRP